MSKATRRLKDEYRKLARRKRAAGEEPLPMKAWARKHAAGKAWLQRKGAST